MCEHRVLCGSSERLPHAPAGVRVVSKEEGSSSCGGRMRRPALHLAIPSDPLRHRTSFRLASNLPRPPAPRPLLTLFLPLSASAASSRWAVIRAACHLARLVQRPCSLVLRQLFGEFHQNHPLLSPALARGTKFYHSGRGCHCVRALGVQSSLKKRRAKSGD